MELSAIQYCANRVAQANAGCLISDGKEVVLFDGQKYTPEEFNNTYPVSGVTKVLHKSKLLKGENSDKRSNWFNDKKSY